MRLVPRFILVISIALTVTYGLFILAAYLTGRGILDKFDEHQSSELLDVIEGQIRTSMLQGESGHLEGILKGVSNAPSVYAAILMRGDGTIIRLAAESDSTAIPTMEIRDAIATGTTDPISTEEEGKPYLYVTVPVERLQKCTRCHEQSDSPIAYLTVKTARHSFGEITKGHRNANILLTGVVFTIVAIVVSLTVLFVVVRPLNRFTRELDERVRSVGTGSEFHDLEPVRYLASDSEEISHMVARFNELSAQLNAANHEVEKIHRRQLESAQNLGYIGEMAAHTAHEIKNPLAGIRGSLSTISSKMSPGDPHREIIERAIKELERIYQSMMDLLTTAKGKPPAFRDVHPNGIISDIVHVLERERRGKNIMFNLHLDSTLPPIKADPNILSQIVWNLVSNAVDAVAAGGWVTVTTRKGGAENNSFMIIVTDNGPGIREEDFTAIFKPFVTGRKDGTGLGLSVVKRGVEVHGGSVQVRSSVGKGATFTVTLPITATDIKEGVS